MKKTFMVLGLLGIMVFVSSCVPQGPTGTVNVYLTDAVKDVQSLKVKIDRVEAHFNDDQSWQIIAQGPEIVDLVQTKGIERYFGSGDVKPGKYTQVRFVISEADATVAGIEKEVTIPSGELKLVHPFEVVEGSELNLLFDFDVDESLVEASGGLQLKPVIKVVAR